MQTRTRKVEREAFVLQRARKLAKTGRHINYLTIERELVRNGFYEARQWLDRYYLRRELQQICNKARAA
jgi:hypothetical protein